jgi:hypothetical protein
MTNGVRQEDVRGFNDPFDRLGIRIKEKLVRIVEQSVLRSPRSGYPESVSLAGMHVGHIAMVDEPCHLRKPKPRFETEIIEEAYLHSFGVLREYGKVRA